MGRGDFSRPDVGRLKPPLPQTGPRVSVERPRRVCPVLTGWPGSFNCGNEIRKIRPYSFRLKFILIPAT